MTDWRKLLTRQSDPWLDKTVPRKTDDPRRYAAAWDKSNHYSPVRYAWDTRKENDR